MAFVKIIGAAALGSLIAGCAVTPDVTATYYLPKAETQITVTQTLGCAPVVDKDGKPTGAFKSVHEVATVSATTTYSSNLDEEPHTIRYTAFDGTFSDADTALTFTDDGRLSGVNSSSTGQGDTIIKDALSIASAVALVGFNVQSKGKVITIPSPDLKNLCDIIADSAPPPADPKKPVAPTVTLTYTVSFFYRRRDDDNLDIVPAPDNATDYANNAPKNDPSCLYDAHAASACLPIIADAGSMPIYQKIATAYPKDIQNYEVRVESQKSPQHLDQDPTDQKSQLGLQNKTFSEELSEHDDKSSTSSNLVELKLNKVVNALVDVKGPAGYFWMSNTIWKGQIPVPLSSTYDLPVPKAAIFGKQQFQLSLSSFGSITKLEYGKTNGTPDVLDSTGALVKALQPQNAAQAAQIQAQSDLIYQQQRLVICQATPASCPSK